MKCAMNSQTLRIWEGKKITDYHIMDGKTATYMIDIIENGKRPDLSNYRCINICDPEHCELTWVKQNDSRIAKYIDVQDVKDYDNCNQYTGVYIMPVKKIKLNNNNTHNETEFRKLWGK